MVQVPPAAGLGNRLLTTTSLKKKGTNNRRSRLLESKVSRRSRCREKVKFALGVTQIEDGTAGSYVMAGPKGTTPLVGVVALETSGIQSGSNNRENLSKDSFDALNNTNPKPRPITITLSNAISIGLSSKT